MLAHPKQYWLSSISYYLPLALIAAVICVSGSSAQAQEHPSVQSNTIVVSVTGQISKNVLSRIRTSVSRVTGDPIPAGLIVLLDSPGGDGMAAMEIGRILRASNAHVFVTGQCASACIFVLASGVVRGAPTLSVGIHRGRITMSDANANVLSDVDVRQNAEARSFLNKYELAAESYLAEMGMSPALFEAMQNHQQKGVYRLSFKELRLFGLVGYEPAYLKERFRAFQNNKKYLISDPDELVRRTSKVASYCAKYDQKQTEFFECYKEVLSDKYLN